MPLEKFPTWTSPQYADLAEAAVDQLIACYAIETGSLVETNLPELDEVAKQVMASLYAAVEAQTEIVVNRRAYSAQL